MRRTALVDMTERRRQFVHELVHRGCTPTEAARRAGYSQPGHEAFRLLRHPLVQAAIRAEREAVVSGSLASVALATLHEVMTDREASPSARVAAARTVLELAGELGKGKSDADEDRPLSELSADELTRLIDRWQDERAALAQSPPGEDAASSMPLNGRNWLTE